MGFEPTTFATLERPSSRETILGCFWLTIMCKTNVNEWAINITRLLVTKKCLLSLQKSVWKKNPMLLKMENDHGVRKKVIGVAIRAFIDVNCDSIS